MKKTIILTVSALFALSLTGVAYQQFLSSKETEIFQEKPNNSQIQTTTPLISASLEIPESALYYGELGGYQKKMEDIFTANSGSLKEFTVQFSRIGTPGKIGAYDEAFLKSLLSTPAHKVTIETQNGFNMNPEDISRFSEFMETKELVFHSNVWLSANNEGECQQFLAKANQKFMTQITGATGLGINQICKTPPPYHIFYKKN